MTAKPNGRGFAPPGLDGPYLKIVDGRLVVDGAELETLAQQFGTPLYVTSERQIRANYRRLRDAFVSRYPRTRLLYANKANSNLAIRRILTEEGAGGDCFGLGELTISLESGLPPEMLVLNGSNKGREELTLAIERGVRINVDHPDELETIGRLAREIGKKAAVNFRILPFSWADRSRLPNDLAEIASDTSHDKWGFDRPSAKATLARALAMPDIQPLGLHMHVSRIRPDPAPFALACDLLAGAIAEFRGAFGWTPEAVDIGGGYAHRRDPESGEPAGSHDVADVEEYAEAIVEAFRKGLAKHNLPEPDLWLEPGRSLVSNATLLLSRVGVVKRLPTGSVTWVNVDASVNHCLRVMLQGYRYEIVAVNRADAEPTDVVTIAGPTCIVDAIAEERALPPLNTGDLIAVLDVGGYAEVLSTQFNLLPRPAGVLVADGSADLIRRRETLADLLNTQIIPDRLALRETPASRRSA